MNGVQDLKFKLTPELYTLPHHIPQMSLKSKASKPVCGSLLQPRGAYKWRCVILSVMNCLYPNMTQGKPVTSVSKGGSLNLCYFLPQYLCLCFAVCQESFPTIPGEFLPRSGLSSPWKPSWNFLELLPTFSPTPKDVCTPIICAYVLLLHPRHWILNCSSPSVSLSSPR